jgi:plastocyanin
VLLVLATTVGCPKQEEKTKDPDPTEKTAEPVAAKKTIDATTTATVTGAVTFSGTPPESTMLKVSSDAACTSVHPKEFSAEDVKVAGGKVENAFVWVKTGLADYTFTAPAGPVQVDQRGCMYNPRMIGVRTGQEIEFLNSDQTLHNIASKPSEQNGWNFVTPMGSSGKRSFKKPEVPIKIGCDVHPWMRAYVGVVDHPFFAVTKADGSFKFAGLPAGTYTIGAWHERLGTIEQSLTVAAKEAKEIALALPGSPSK